MNKVMARFVRGGRPAGRDRLPVGDQQADRGPHHLRPGRRGRLARAGAHCPAAARGRGCRKPRVGRRVFRLQVTQRPHPLPGPNPPLPAGARGPDAAVRPAAPSPASRLLSLLPWAGLPLPGDGWTIKRVLPTVCCTSSVASLSTLPPEARYPRSLVSRVGEAGEDRSAQGHVDPDPGLLWVSDCPRPP